MHEVLLLVGIQHRELLAEPKLGVVLSQQPQAKLQQNR
jgi:hypothetical protein